MIRSLPESPALRATLTHSPPRTLQEVTPALFSRIALCIRSPHFQVRVQPHARCSWSNVCTYSLSCSLSVHVLLPARSYTHSPPCSLAVHVLPPVRS